MHELPETARPVELLLVEDNATDVRLTIEALRDGKVANRLSVVSDGVEALLYLRRAHPYTQAHRPDLVLLDLNLPRKSGREVLAEIRRDPQFGTLPVAIVTASASEEDHREAQRLGAICYVTKPIGVDELIGIVLLVQDFAITVISVASMSDSEPAVVP